MLIRDKIGERLLKEIKERGSNELEIVSLDNDEDFFEAIIEKLSNELDLFYVSRDITNLVEVIELLDWIKVALGMTKLSDLVEDKKEDLGLYWNRYYIKEKE